VYQALISLAGIQTKNEERMSRLLLISVFTGLLLVACQPLPVEITPVTIAQTPVAEKTAYPLCFESFYAPLAFLPDGLKLLIKGDAAVQVVNLETLEVEQQIDAPMNFGGPALAVSPDGELLAWVLENFTVQIIRLADQVHLHNLVGHTGLVTKVKFAPMGDRLYTASHDGWVRIWNLEGEQVDAFRPGGGEVLGLGISADSALLATVPYDGPVKIWDIATQSFVTELGGSGGYDTSDAGFSPDEQFLAADLASGLHLWSMSDQTLSLSGINSMAFAFSPDRQYLAYAVIGENNAVVLATEDGTRIIRTLEGHSLPAWEVIFSPDSSLLASADGIEIRIWGVEHGELLYVGKAACP
jgi:WD40 repeat protein